MPGSRLLRILYRIIPRSYYEYATEELKGLQTKRTLDVGSGAGHLAKGLKGKHVVGIDVDLELLKMASGDRVLASACFSPFRDSSFDLVIFHDSLHHLERPLEGFKETARVLVRGGLMVIFDFDLSFFPVKILMFLEKLFGFPANFFTLERLLKLEWFKPVMYKKGTYGNFVLMMERV